jgi:hypothetical protein
MLLHDAMLRMSSSDATLGFFSSSNSVSIYSTTFGVVKLFKFVLVIDVGDKRTGVAPYCSLAIGLL